MRSGYSVRLLLVILWTSVFLGVNCHHCDDEQGPYKKLSKCNANKTHFCYNLSEDLSSFTCRCTNDASCKEPCGINIFRAWSSEGGSWIKKLRKANRIPHIPIKTYATCKNVPHKVLAPHRTPYTMCMCNDHYYSYGFNVKDEYEMRNFTKTLRLRLRFEKPKMYVLSPDHYEKNLPYVHMSNFAYRNCTPVTQGESYHPTDFLGTSWCNQTFCEQNNPYGRDRPNAKYRVMKCAETCACFLEPNEETFKKAQVRNKMIEVHKSRSEQERKSDIEKFEKEDPENSNNGNTEDPSQSSGEKGETVSLSSSDTVSADDSTIMQDKSQL